MFSLAGVGLSVFLLVLLLSKSNKTVADKLLAAWLLIIGTISWRSIALHLMAPLCVLVYLIPFLLLPLEAKIRVYENQGIGYETFNAVRSIAIILSGIVYIGLSSWILREHRKKIVNTFSNTDRINLQWLQYLIYWIGLIWLLVIVANDDWVFAAAVLFVAFIGFFGIRQVNIFQAVNPVENEKTETVRDPVREPEKVKYQKSGLTESMAEQLHQDMNALMLERKLYTKSELSLNELAEELRAAPNHLSQIINEREGKNFYDYINSLRVEEFKALVTSGEARKYTLFALAQQCGFNSKSSFNRFFKKSTGQSPSEFLQSLSVEA